MDQIHISRSEQKIMYYWTGAAWTTDKKQAKLFNSASEAQKEMKVKGIKYTVSYSK